eukprot:tig00000459_g1106.t1
MSCRCGEKGKDGGCCRPNPAKNCGCVKNHRGCGPACACGANCKWRRDDPNAAPGPAAAPANVLIVSDEEGGAFEFDPAAGAPTASAAPPTLPPPRPDPQPWPLRAAGAPDLDVGDCGCAKGGCRVDHSRCRCKGHGIACGPGCACGGSCMWNASSAPKLPRRRVQQPGAHGEPAQSYHEEFKADPELRERVEWRYKEWEKICATALRQNVNPGRREQIGALRGGRCPYTGVPTAGLRSDAARSEHVPAVDHIIEMQVASRVFTIALARAPLTTADEADRARRTLYDLLNKDWNLVLTTRQVNETKRDIFKPFVCGQSSRLPQAFEEDCTSTGLVLKGVAEKGVLNHAPIRDSDEARTCPVPSTPRPPPPPTCTLPLPPPLPRPPPPPGRAPSFPAFSSTPRPRPFLLGSPLPSCPRPSPRQYLIPAPAPYPRHPPTSAPPPHPLLPRSPTSAPPSHPLSPGPADPAPLSPPLSPYPSPLPPLSVSRPTPANPSFPASLICPRCFLILQARILTVFCAASALLSRKLREASDCLGLPLLRGTAEEVETLVALSGVPRALELDPEALDPLCCALEAGPVPLSLTGGKRRSRGPAPPAVAAAAPPDPAAAPAVPLAASPGKPRKRSGAPGRGAPAPPPLPLPLPHPRTSSTPAEPFLAAGSALEDLSARSAATVASGRSRSGAPGAPRTRSSTRSGGQAAAADGAGADLISVRSIASWFLPSASGPPQPLAVEA